MNDSIQFAKKFNMLPFFKE